MKGMSGKPRTIIISVIATLLAVLLLQNVRAVTLRFVVWEVSLPLALVVAVGFGLGYGVAWFWRRR